MLLRCFRANLRLTHQPDLQIGTVTFLRHSKTCRQVKKKKTLAWFTSGLFKKKGAWVLGVHAGWKVIRVREVHWSAWTENVGREIEWYWAVINYPTYGTMGESRIQHAAFRTVGAHQKEKILTAVPWLLKRHKRHTDTKKIITPQTWVDKSLSLFLTLSPALSLSLSPDFLKVELKMLCPIWVNFVYVYTATCL